MAKLMVIPNCYEDITNIIEHVDSIAVGLRDLSVNFLELDLEQIEHILIDIHNQNKKLFVSLNKNMHNNDLENVRKALIKFEELRIDGIFYCDVGVLNIHRELKLQIPLVWSAEHLATNYNTINYWSKFNLSYVFLSNEITKEEVTVIKEHSKIPLIVQAFGYVPMYISKRHAIKNYLEHFKLKTDSKDFYIYKEEKKYPILERKDNTEIYSYFILNAIEEYGTMDVAYILLNGFKINIQLFLQVIDLFNNVNEKNKDEFKNKIDQLFDNTDLGFIYKEAIYQVKKNEK